MAHHNGFYVDTRTTQTVSSPTINLSRHNSTATSGSSSPTDKHFVVAAIDFGTTYSGYAFSFTRDQDSIHMMRKWEGGDPGVSNQKTPTTLLLKPNGEFHSFGFGARDYYHDLEELEARKWYYFEKFKMSLHSSQVSSSILYDMTIAICWCRSKQLHIIMVNQYKNHYNYIDDGGLWKNRVVKFVLSFLFVWLANSLAMNTHSLEYLDSYSIEE